MAALKKISLAVFVWARRICVQCAKKEASRKILLGRRTKASTHREVANINTRISGEWHELSRLISHRIYSVVIREVNLLLFVQTLVSQHCPLEVIQT